MNPRELSVCFLLAAGVFFTGWATSGFADEPAGSTQAAETNSAAADTKQPSADGWKPLMGKWEVCVFGGDGPVEIGKEKIELGYGDPLTGIRWDGKFPRDSYEIRCEGRRTDGLDFFCGLTFPVGEGKCSLVLGGWGGGVLGLSSVDGADASENETTQFKTFDNNRWYKIRIRVAPEQITCWIDDQVWVEQRRENHEFDIRIEMDPTLPLGIANFQCSSEFRNLQWRPLPSGDRSETETAGEGES